MIALPWSMWVSVRRPDRKSVRVWLPLLLLWLILLPLVVLAFAITVIVDIAMLVAGQDYHHYTLLLYRCLALIGDTRGMVVTVHGDGTDVDISIR
ncbi:MAG TPA: hypothetical protein VFG89_00440 [Coriobacteriia bacterium]|nr:hypothetical protein [Coriobacteriia bacterium]